MKLTARLLPMGEASRRALTSLLPSGAPAVVSARYGVDIMHPAFGEILAAGDLEGGFRVSGEVVLSGAELRRLTHYEVACRSIVRENAADFAANDAVRQRTPLVDTPGGGRIRLMSGLFLSRVALKPNMVGSIGDWTEEYVAAAGVVKVFRDAALSGVEFHPVKRPRTNVAHDAIFQLFSTAVLPAAVIDESVERIDSMFAEEHGRLRHLGCLAYEPPALRDRPDFNRTAEPWAGWHGWPAWVVSARVREVFGASKLRGWHFRPVFATDTDLYAEYARHWRMLRDAVRATSKSAFDGGRW